MNVDALLNTSAASVFFGTPETQHRDLNVRILMLRRILEDVVKMRQCQRQYFRYKSPQAMRDCKRLEKSVDAQVEVVFSVPGLFDVVEVTDPETGDKLLLDQAAERLLDAKLDEVDATMQLGEPILQFSEDGTAGAGN